MAASVYECLFLLDTSKVAGDVPAAEKQLQGILEKNHAEILAHRPWDERRLSYPIKKQKKGLYYMTYVRTEGKNIVGIERDCVLNEMIMRSMILRIEPKWVDVMLALAKGDEAAIALHNIQQDPVDDMGDDMDERPRRRRKDD
jgi:small subunit ribosomal protein S6